MQFKGVKLMKTQRDGVAVTTDLYTFDPRYIYDMI
jgi:hypothetical protein